MDSSGLNRPRYEMSLIIGLTRDSTSLVYRKVSFSNHYQCHTYRKQLEPLASLVVSVLAYKAEGHGYESRQVQLNLARGLSLETTFVISSC